jgi:hypothetical protein
VVDQGIEIDRSSTGVFGKGRKRFFLKKEAKTFANWFGQGRFRSKSFLVLFCKKELLESAMSPSCLPNSGVPIPPHAQKALP